MFIIIVCSIEDEREYNVEIYGINDDPEENEKHVVDQELRPYNTVRFESNKLVTSKETVNL